MNAVYNEDIYLYSMLLKETLNTYNCEKILTLYFSALPVNKYGLRLFAMPEYDIGIYHRKAGYKMAFIDERIPQEKWAFVKKYAPDLEINKYSHWLADYENDIYWVRVGINSLEHLMTHLLIWKGKKTFIDTYGWVEGSEDGNICSFDNIIGFYADASLKPYKEEMIRIVTEAFSAEHEGAHKIVEMEEPDFSRTIE